MAIENLLTKFGINRQCKYMHVGIKIEHALEPMFVGWKDG
jgi:hypothetical protein